MGSVRAKFYVETVSRHAANHGSVKLRPVSRGDENAGWASATPSGEITMSVNNNGALALFSDHLGDECYVDFTFTEPLGEHAFRQDVRCTPEVPGMEWTKQWSGRCGECGLDESQHTPKK